MRLLYQIIKGFVLVLVICSAGLCEDSGENPFNRFEQEFNSLKPNPYSSVGADYKSEQTALGTFYMNKTLGMIYEQNRELMNQNSEIIDRYDQLIDQNSKIIELLTKIAKNESGK